MTIHTVGIERGRRTLSQLASRAHAGQPSLLTRYGRPYAAIVAPSVLLQARPRPGFLALRGLSKGLWRDAEARTVTGLRDEWPR